MALGQSFVLLVLLLLAAASAAFTGSDQNEEVHELLPKFGLPKGLVPGTVVSYSLAEDGAFEVELAAPCYVQFSYLVYYEKKIRGKISYGSISDLSGIQAKKFFFFVSISSIVAHPDARTIEFKVGFLSESLSISEFATVPTCEAKSCRQEGRCGSRFFPEELLPLSEI